MPFSPLYSVAVGPVRLSKYRIAVSFPLFIFSTICPAELRLRRDCTLFADVFCGGGFDTSVSASQNTILPKTAESSELWEGVIQY